MDGVLLLMRHSEIVGRDCKVCQKFVFDEDKGTIEFGRDGKPELRLLNCGAEFLAPCRDPRRSCPKGTPENPRTLTEDNQLCYEHYLECRAIGQFPDDSVVRQNAAIIREVIDSVERARTVEFQGTLLKMMPQ